MTFLTFGKKGYVPKLTVLGPMLFSFKINVMKQNQALKQIAAHCLITSSQSFLNWYNFFYASAFFCQESNEIDYFFGRKNDLIIWKHQFLSYKVIY